MAAATPEKWQLWKEEEEAYITPDEHTKSEGREVSEISSYDTREKRRRR